MPHKPRIRSRRLAAASAFVAAMLSLFILAACSGSSDESRPTEVTIGFPQPVVTLDTNRALDPLTYILIHLVGATLTTVDASGEVGPGIAESWTLSDDRLTYTFTMRDDVTFSDDTPLTADDVAATLNRFLTDKANLNAALGEKIDSVTAPDGSTVVVTLKEPYASLLTYLATPSFAIYPKSAFADTETFFQQPISAGPYAIEDLGGGDNPVLTRNESYYGPAPRVETLRFVLIEDPNTRAAQLSSGEIDIAADIPPAVLPQVPSDAQVDAVSIYGVSGLFTSNTDDLLKDVRIRQAIDAAVDRGQINDVVWSGEIQPLSGLWPSTMTGHDPDQVTTADTAKAKELLAGTACESGCSIELLTTPFFSWSDATAVVVKENLAEIGIDAKITSVEAGTWFDRVARGDYQSTLGVLYDFVDAPDAILLFGLQSTPYNAQGTNYKSAEMDELIRKVTTADETEREAALDEIEALFATDRPWITISDYSVISASTLPEGLVTFSSSSFYDVASEE